MALDALFRALKRGLYIERQLQDVVSVLDERGDIIRIKSAELLHAMAVGNNDISKAEGPLRERLEDDNRVVVYYSALGLGKICWNRGDFEGLGEVMPFMTDDDRLQILRTIENMPAQQ
jgi:hypothetical protein